MLLCKKKKKKVFFLMSDMDNFEDDIVELGEIRTNEAETPLQTYGEAYNFIRGMIEDKRCPDIYLNEQNQRCIRDLQIKQLACSLRMGVIVLMTLRNRNKHPSDPDKNFSVIIKLNPENALCATGLLAVRPAEFELLAYMGKRFDSMNHIEDDSHDWHQTFALSQARDMVELLDQMEGKVWD